MSCRIRTFGRVRSRKDTTGLPSFYSELPIIGLVGAWANKVRKGPEPPKGARPESCPEGLLFAQVRPPRRLRPRRRLRRRLLPPPEPVGVLTEELAGVISLNFATCSSPPRASSLSRFLRSLSSLALLKGSLDGNEKVLTTRTSWNRPKTKVKSYGIAPTYGSQEGFDAAAEQIELEVLRLCRAG
jgi:hypothetical protein